MTVNSSSTVRSSWNQHVQLDDQKRGLARLMARENIRVEHGAYDTAMFDLKSRTLLLPMWKDVTLDQYDLLIGHEVGHALYSDDLSYIEDCKVQPGLHTFVNVLEDVRIEKRVKDAFPGMRGVFARGYRDFYEHGPLFQLDRPIAEYSFIDRVNIHYKLGEHIAVPFSDTERALLPRIEQTRSMTDVIALAKELYGAAKEQQQEQPQQTAPSKSMASEDASESQPSSAPVADMSNESDESSESSESNESSESAESSESKADDGIYAETDQMNADALRTLAGANETHDAYNAVTHATHRVLPDALVDSCTVSLTTYLEQCRRCETSSFAPLIDKSLADLTQQYSATAAHMAREFDRRKSAQQHARARVATTGRLNLKKLPFYKFREDLFDQITILPNGQSHGLQVLIDGSGSMANVFEDVVEQAFLFALFAKSVRIPCQVFVFQTRMSYEMTPTTLTSAGTLLPNSVELVTLIDTTTKVPMRAQLRGLAHLHAAFASGNPHYAAGVRLNQTPLYGGMLLLESHLVRMQTRLQLQKMTVLVLTDGEDSDGLKTDTMPVSGYHHRRLVVHDTLTRKTFVGFTDDSIGYTTDPMILNRLMHHVFTRGHHASYIRLYIARDRDCTSNRAARTLHCAMKVLNASLDETHAATLTREKMVAVTRSTQPSLLADAVLVVSSRKLDLSDDAFEDLDTSSMSARTIMRTFMKRSVASTQNRVLVNAVMPYIA